MDAETGCFVKLFQFAFSRREKVGVKILMESTRDVETPYILYSSVMIASALNFQLKNEVSLISHLKGRKHLEMMRKELNRSEQMTEQESVGSHTSSVFSIVKDPCLGFCFFPITIQYCD